ncbi:transcription termination factor MTEF18, mitochondrial [Neltuma alba]|uniref:transcription termination factor MTEF18, mitochondrial n=1 Tax=Neltuma alba TaxID=207710 RepID=UPI0010A5939B|nr:transcription termination factor MTEF18, mitochondrial-like [Prosopis alba]
MFLNSFAKIFLRHISTTSSTTRKLLKSSKIPQRYQKFAVREAQKVLTDYLHETRCLPFVLADQIAKNSLLSLVNLIVKVDFSASTFSRNFEKYLRYNPIDEFEFFFESIGIDYNNGVSELLPPNKVFFSEDGSLLEAARALSFFGFPWDKLGNLYKECSSVFRRSSKELGSKLYEFKKRGFGNVEVVGICLAFPNILGKEGEEVDGEIDGLFTDLKSVFFDFELARYVEGNIDSWHEVCRKIRVFYNLNGEKGKLGELMGRAKTIFIEYGEDELIQKAEYFCRFGVQKEEVALLLLKAPELLNLDLQMPVVSVSKLLKHFGLSPKILEDVSKKYDHVLGTNKMDNLPNVMRALDLHGWFFNKMKDGNHNLLISYLATHPNEEKDKEYQAGLTMICASSSRNHMLSKLNFLHGLGFGENAVTIDIAAYLHGYSWKLQKRFFICSGSLFFVFPLSGLCSINGVPSTPCPEGSWRNVNCCLCKAAARVQTCDRVVKKELGISYLARLRFRLKDPKC